MDSNIELLNAQVEVGRALERLYENDDFKLLETLWDKDVVQTVVTNLHTKHPDNRIKSMDQLMARSIRRNFLDTKILDAQNAILALRESDDEDEDDIEDAQAFADMQGNDGE